MMEADEVKQLVRKWFCRDCEGTRLGKEDCLSEDFCSGFSDECKRVKKEDDDAHS